MRRVYRHELAGQKFGKLTVLYRTDKRLHGKVLWHCECECGNRCDVLSTRLVSGHTKSCGCFNSEQAIDMNTTHNHSKTRLYSIWSGMKTRCYNTKRHDYRWYGARGVTVCDEWLHDFAAFEAWALSNGYSDDLTIDRIDCDAGYAPDNCRWVTMREQRINQRRMQNAV